MTSLLFLLERFLLQLEKKAWDWSRLLFPWEGNLTLQMTLAQLPSFFSPLSSEKIHLLFALKIQTFFSTCAEKNNLLLRIQAWCACLIFFPVSAIPSWPNLSLSLCRSLSLSQLNLSNGRTKITKYGIPALLWPLTFLVSAKIKQRCR